QLNLNDFSMLVIGPGLGRSNDTEYILETALKSELPCVIDADGLFFLKNHLDLLKVRKALTVITPHLGEYQRIFDYKEDSIVNDLINISKEYDNTVIVLKGEHTLVAYQGKITVNTTGNNALAKGGSGDVLCGVIGALLAQRCDIDSVVAGVYIHSYGADKWVENNSSYSLMASDLIEMIDKVLFEMTRS
ncbi:MAG: NAD(P)H-hydrate dehydratase, partial [Erysipelotrichaceae bacterium]|nr:NAD(P)H-hydrate dehydratase [Erysipelotrichaceae bacterium]